MARRQTPRSMLQQFIENVPTTAPIKRTRSRTRSPVELNETALQKKKKRLSVQQTPRSMIESYVHERKTQTPFIKTTRRRSNKGTFTNVQNHSIVTPRTALQDYIIEAPDESPYEKPFTSHENSDSNVHLPDETIAVSYSPNISTQSGTPSMVLPRKKKEGKKHHITLQKFSQGMNNLTTNITAANEENPFSSTESEISMDINDVIDSLNTDQLTTTRQQSHNNHNDSENHHIATMEQTYTNENHNNSSVRRMSRVDQQTPGQKLKDEDLYIRNSSKAADLYIRNSNKAVDFVSEKKLVNEEESDNDEELRNEERSYRNKSMPRLSTSYRNSTKARLSSSVPLENQIDAEVLGNEESSYREISMPRSRLSTSYRNNSRAGLSSSGSAENQIDEDDEAENEERGSNRNSSVSGRSTSYRNSSKPRLSSSVLAENQINEDVEAENGERRSFRNSSKVILSNSKSTENQIDEEVSGNEDMSSYKNKSSIRHSKSVSEENQIDEEVSGNEEGSSYRKRSSSRHPKSVSEENQIDEDVSGNEEESSNRNNTKTRLSEKLIDKDIQESENVEERLREKKIMSKNSSKARLSGSVLLDKQNYEVKRSSYGNISKPDFVSVNEQISGKEESNDIEKSTINKNNNNAVLLDFVPTEKHGVEESYNEDEDTENFLLYTPHLQENISHLPTPICSSTPAHFKKPKPAAQVIKEQNQVKSRPKSSAKTNLTSSVLPNNVIKQVFQHFSNMRVAPTVMKELIEFTDTYFKHTFRSLETFANHSGRGTVNETDVELMMKRQGLITSKQPLEVLVEKTLPLEQRQEVIPMATAYNQVLPS